MRANSLDSSTCAVYADMDFDNISYEAFTLETEMLEEQRVWGWIKRQLCRAAAIQQLLMTEDYDNFEDNWEYCSGLGRD